MWFFKILGQRLANVTLRFLPLVLVTVFLPKPYNLGGPSSLSALGLFLECFKHEEVEEIYACHYGIEGLLKEDLIDVRKISKYKLMQLKDKAGAYFGSCRYQIKDEKDYDRILEIFKKYNIRYFFYNGGNDSMDTCNKISWI